MSKFKFEIIKVVCNTSPIPNAMGDNQDKAIFTVKYRVRFHNTMTMDSEEVLWASDELDAYNRAKQLIKEKTNNVIQDTRRTR